MKNNISDFFKEKAHLLDEMPSSKTWNNVRSKLDNRHKKSKLIKVLNITLGIAASTLIIVNVMWVMGSLGQKTNVNNIAQLTEFTPSPWSIYNEIPQHEAMNVSHNSKDYINKNPKDIKSVSWQYMDASPKNITNLNAISGTWLLPAWHKIDNKLNLPKSLKIFHTNDQRYYLHLNEMANEAYLLQASEKQDKFKVLHPNINYIDNSNNTVLIVFFENGLIVDYRKVKNGLTQI